MTQLRNSKKIDPLDIALLLIIAGITSGVGGAVATIDYIDRRRGQQYGRIYRELSDHLAQLDDELSYLGRDIDILERIFGGTTDKDRSRPVSFGSGVYLTVGDFMRYERTSDAAIGRIRRINKLTSKVERLASQLAPQGVRAPLKESSSAMGKIERLVRLKDLSVGEAWQLARSAVDDLLAAIRSLRHQLKEAEGE
jgi:hypothetical protein